MSQRLRFGIFLAPFDKPGINPTLALQSDLELIQWLDRCGYDEAWLGEHHSAGTELSASPEIMIATAAERTRNIKLGTGVVSVSYHNPLWVAERIVLLDHRRAGLAAARRIARRGSGSRRSHPTISAANNPSSVAADALCRHTPKVGAACGNSARAVLCGGRSVTTVPTANRAEPAAGSAMSAVLQSLPKR